MPAATFNLSGNYKIEQGATYIIGLRYKDTDGQPIDLTGWYGWMQARPRDDSEDDEILFKIHSTPPNDFQHGGLILSNGIGIDVQGNPIPTPNIIIIIPDWQTARIEATAGLYDIVLKSPEGLTLRLMEGVVHIDLSVTRRRHDEDD